MRTCHLRVTGYVKLTLPLTWSCRVGTLEDPCSGLKAFCENSQSLKPAPTITFTLRSRETLTSAQTPEPERAAQFTTTVAAVLH